MIILTNRYLEIIMHDILKQKPHEISIKNSIFNFENKWTQLFKIYLKIKHTETWTDV